MGFTMSRVSDSPTPPIPVLTLPCTHTGRQSQISVLTQPCAHVGRQSQTSVLSLLSALTPYPVHNPVLSLRASERCNMVNPTRVNGAQSAILTVWGCGTCSIESASEMRNFTFMFMGEG